MLIHLALLVRKKVLRALHDIAPFGHNLVDDPFEFRFQVTGREEVLEGKQGQYDGGDDERQLEEAAEEPEQTDGGKDDEKDDHPIFGHEAGNGIHRDPSLCVIGLINTIPL